MKIWETMQIGKLVYLIFCIIVFDELCNFYCCCSNYWILCLRFVIWINLSFLSVDNTFISCMWWLVFLCWFLWFLMGLSFSVKWPKITWQCNYISFHSDFNKLISFMFDFGINMFLWKTISLCGCCWCYVKWDCFSLLIFYFVEMNLR